MIDFRTDVGPPSNIDMANFKISKKIPTASANFLNPRELFLYMSEKIKNDIAAKNKKQVINTGVGVLAITANK